MRFALSPSISEEEFSSFLKRNFPRMKEARAKTKFAAWLTERAEKEIGELRQYFAATKTEGTERQGDTDKFYEDMLKKHVYATEDEFLVDRLALADYEGQLFLEQYKTLPQGEKKGALIQRIGQRRYERLMEIKKWLLSAPKKRTMEAVAEYRLLEEEGVEYALDNRTRVDLNDAFLGVISTLKAK